jgi:hypothetical protein
MTTPHPDYDLDWIAKRARLIFDARNAYADRTDANVVRL